MFANRGRVVLTSAGLIAGLASMSAAAASPLVSPSHLVVPNKGVKGAYIGDTAKSVKRHFGNSTSGEDNCGGPAKNCFTWYYGKSKRMMGFQLHKQGDINSATLLYIEFDSAKDETSKGIHIGESVKDVRKAYPKCPTYDSYCFLTGKGSGKMVKDGQRYTYVYFNGKTVTAFIVGKYEKKYEECLFGECGD